MGYAESPALDAPDPGLSTHFAPAGRERPEALRILAEACLAHPVVSFLTEAMGALVMVLDEHRQILAGSRALRATLGLGPTESLVGQRPGELMGCLKVPEGPDGCGTSSACAYCGLVLAFLKVQASGLPVRAECFLTRRRQSRIEAVEYEVSASPLPLCGARLVVVALHDLSALKRKETLERLFCHDVANLAQGIHGWAELLALGEPTADLAPRLLQLTDLLNREIRNHRAMIQAERGLLQPSTRPVLAREALEEVRQLLARHPAAEGRHMRVELPQEEAPVFTDPELLARVLSNMAVNALEACPAGGWVTLSAQRRGFSYRFQVHNPGEMTPMVRDRVFQRSFSTKAGRGRGLGTYAMKLFGENILGGRVAFDTGPSGTTFFIDLPQRPT